MVDRPAARHHHEPPGDGRARAVVLRAVAPRLREHFLRDILGLGAVADDAESERVDGSGVAIIKIGQRGLVAADHAIHDQPILIRRVECGRCHYLRPGLAIG